MYFQEVVTAYRTLADPERRSSYDAGLRDARGIEVSPAARPWPDVPAEPLVPRGEPPVFLTVCIRVGR